MRGTSKTFRYNEQTCKINYKVHLKHTEKKLKKLNYLENQQIPLRIITFSIQEISPSQII